MDQILEKVKAAVWASMRIEHFAIAGHKGSSEIVTNCRPVK
jgi:hypothetical protein